jgi:competence protein ComEC
MATTRFVIPLLLLLASTAAAKELKVTFMPHHVGAVIETPNGRVYVLDPGGAATREDIIPFLQARGTRIIDGIIITHPHIDHFAGVPRLLSRFRVKKLFDTGHRGGDAHPDYEGKVIPLALRAGVERRSGLQSGDRLNLDRDLEAKVLWPPRPFLRAGDTQAQITNNNSLGLWLRHGQVAFLFPGDAPEENQAGLARRWAREVRRTNVFSLPHHGKRYFHPALARRVSARVRKESFAFANDDALARTVKQWRAHGVRVMEARRHGQVQVTSSGGGFRVEAARSGVRRTYGRFVPSS